MGLYAGFSLSLGVGTIVDDVLGWKWAYVLAALGGFLVAIVAFWTVPEPQPPPPPPPPSRAGVEVGIREEVGVVVAVGLPGAARFSADVAPFASRSAINSSSGFAYAAVAGDYPEGVGNGGLSVGGGGGIAGGGGSGRRNGNSSGNSVGNGTNSGRSNVNGNSSGKSSGNGIGNGTPEGDLSPASRDTRTGGARLRSSALSPLLSPPPPPSPPPPLPALTPRPPSSSPLHRLLGKLPALSEAWLGSPSLLLVCVAGGVRDAGGFVFGYYMSSYFSPLMDGNAALTRHGGAGPCSTSYDAGYVGRQVGG